MLPPFVPPSARVPKESLPLITEFVIERVSQVTVTLSAPPPFTFTEDVSALPSIDEFVMERPSAPGAQSEAHAPQSAEEPAPEEAPSEPVHQASAAEQTPAPSATHHDVEAGPRPADQPAAGIAPQELEREEGEPIPPAESEIILPPISADASEVKESTPPGARFNDETAEAMAEAPGITMSEAWDASAVSPAQAGEESAERAHIEDEHDAWGETPGAGAGAEQPQTSESAWVAEERDAFDWQGVGTIATGPDDARRASEEWAGTEWEPHRNPEHEQVATALVQLARRVRAGEVKVDLPANATVEASLAALLAALLADDAR